LLETTVPLRINLFSLLIVESSLWRRAGSFGRRRFLGDGGLDARKLAPCLSYFGCVLHLADGVLDAKGEFFGGQLYFKLVQLFGALA
jgi:hypothetical protein